MLKSDFEYARRFWIGVLIFLFFIIVSASVFADQSTLVPTSGSHTSWSGGVTEGTFTVSTRTEIDATCYTNVGSANDVLCLENEGSTSLDPYFEVNFTLPTFTTLNWMNFIARGRSSTATIVPCTVSAFNYSSNAWMNLSQTQCSSAGLVNTTYNMTNTGMLSDFRNGQIVTMRYWINSTPTNDDLNSDYLALQVDYTTTSSCTYGGSGDWLVTLSDNCEVSTTVNLGANKLVMTGTGKFTIVSGGILKTKSTHFTPSAFNGGSVFGVLAGGKLEYII